MAGAGLHSVAVLADHLIRLFTVCGSLPDANDTFTSVPKPTVFTWNAIISAHTKLSDCHRALLLYCDMQRQGVKPNRVTFLCVLKACGGLQALSCGRQTHDDIISTGLKSDGVVANMLIDMYSKCGSLCEARRVFDELQYQRDVVSWSAMIAGYAQHGCGFAALDLYKKMQEGGIRPENTTFSSILKACGSIGAVHQGRQIHDQISRDGLLSDVIIGGTLIDMYVRCGKVKEARFVFDSLPNRDGVSWGTMISGYAQHGYGFSALELFGEMQQKLIQPDRATYLCVLKACGLVGAIEEGRLVHEQLIKQNLESDMAVGNTIVDMYASCANLEDACKVFNKLSNPDVVSWGAIISGYAERGQGMLVQKSLKKMQCQGSEPDTVIFTSILSACSHAGLLDEGCHYLKCMSEYYRVTPSIEHYNCMVDLLGRAGCLDEAEALLLTMPILPDVIGWTSLLAGCKTYSNTQLARHCLDRVFELNPEEGSAYVLISNIHADACRWEDVEKIEELRKCAGAWKKPGQAWIEVEKKAYEFIVGGFSQDICVVLKRVSGLLKGKGYVPQVDSVLESDMESGQESEYVWSS